MTAGGSMACDSCGGKRDGGFGPCASCGAVRGEDNRCAACQALAGVREDAPDRYACLACGAPRRLRPNTHVSLDFVGELESRAKMARLTSRIMFGMAAIIGVGSLAIGGLLALGSATAGAVLILLGGGVAGASALFARSKAGAAQQDDAMAARRRLLAVVRSTPRGVTVEDATRAARQDPQQVDALLTELAKAGSVDMDVDDNGTIRYRVADFDAGFDDSADELADDAERGATD